MQKFIRLLIIFSILATYHTNAQQLPDLGNYSSIVLPEAQEQQLGKAFMQQLNKQILINHDPLINDYINSIGNRIAEHANNHWTNFHFFIVNDPEINAFAGPGGYIGINSGLILTTQSESELAAALAHEITHVNQHHIARMVNHVKNLNLPALAALLATIVIGGQTNSSAAIAAAMAALGGGAQNMINFTRGNEEEADRIGIQALYRAGFDPMAMPIFFQRMQRAAINYSDRIPAYLEDHPVTDVRIADAENRARQYPQKKITSSLDYYLTCARLRVTESSKSSSDAVDYFQNQLKNHSYSNLNATKYGYALALIKADKPKTAIQVINNLIANDPNQVIYQMALANIEMSNKHPTEATKILHDSLALYPDYYPLIVQYAQTLLKAKHPNAASLFLKEQILNYPDNEILYKLLARAQGESGKLGDAYQSMAKLYEFQGDFDMAIVQLQQALRLPHPDSDTKAIIKAKIESLKNLKQTKNNIKI
jgi:predicted Zn-dependent protease